MDRSGNKNKTTAVILAFLFGWLGIHWFYLGRPAKGIIYIIASLFLIGILLAFIDFFVLLCTSQEDFDREYNNQIEKTDKYEQLANLAKLKDSNILTVEEFEIEKNKILKNG